MNNKSLIEQLPWFKGFDATATLYIRKLVTKNGKVTKHRTGTIVIARPENSNSLVITGAIVAPTDTFNAKTSAKLTAKRLLGKEHTITINTIDDLQIKDIPTLLDKLGIYPKLFFQFNGMTYPEYIWGMDWHEHSVSTMSSIKKICQRLFE